MGKLEKNLSRLPENGFTTKIYYYRGFCRKKEALYIQGKKVAESFSVSSHKIKDA